MNGPRAAIPMTRIRMTVIVDVPTANLKVIDPDELGPNTVRAIIREKTAMFVNAIPELQESMATVVSVH
jgi:hypothetical protein